MYLKNLRDINFLYIGIFPVSYKTFNYVKNINKKECYFCYIICLIDKSNCSECWKNVLLQNKKL